MTERAWRRLRQTMPNADTPAQTASLRMALRSLLRDTEAYPLHVQEEQYIRDRLDEAGWSEDVRRTLEMMTERWKRQRLH